MRLLIQIAIISLLVIGGCTAITSEWGEVGEDGIVYHLPRTILSISVSKFEDTKRGVVWYQMGGFEEIRGSNNAIERRELKDIQDITVPDPAHRYYLKYRPSALSDDRLCITRSPQGLLHDIEFAADDRTPQIAFNIARFVAGAVKTKTSFIQQKNVSGTTHITQLTKSVLVDPFDSQFTHDAINRNLSTIFEDKIEIDFSKLRTILEQSQTNMAPGCSFKDQGGCLKSVWNKRCTPGHICYRTKLRLPVFLKVNRQAVDVEYAPIINIFDMGSISVKRAFLVHSITRLRFEDGALLGAFIRKPSEVEELSLLPIHVMNAALATPSGLWETAWTGSTALKAKQVEDVAKLQEKVAALQSQSQNQFNDISPDKLTIEEPGSYKPECRIKRDVAGFINIIDFKK